MKNYLIVSMGLLTFFPALAVAAALTVVDADGRVTTYEISDLNGFAPHFIATSNEFVEGKPEFAGPLARDVLRASGIDLDATVRLTAANDYTVEVDAGEFQEYDVILSLSVDGVPLSRRDKGPIWMIYPMSDHVELQDPVFNNRLIWQLVRIEAMK